MCLSYEYNLSLSCYISIFPASDDAHSHQWYVSGPTVRDVCGRTDDRGIHANVHMRSTARVIRRVLWTLWPRDYPPSSPHFSFPLAAIHSSRILLAKGRCRSCSLLLRYNANALATLRRLSPLPKSNNVISPFINFFWDIDPALPRLMLILYNKTLG